MWPRLTPGPVKGLPRREPGAVKGVAAPSPRTNNLAFIRQQAHGKIVKQLAEGPKSQFLTEKI